MKENNHKRVRRIYRNYYQLMEDIPYIKDKTILVTKGFEYSLLVLDNNFYKSLKLQLKRQNIKVIFIKERTNGNRTNNNN